MLVSAYLYFSIYKPVVFIRQKVQKIKTLNEEKGKEKKRTPEAQTETDLLFVGFWHISNDTSPKQRYAQ